MRRILFEIPNAQLLAWIVAGLAVVYALYHAFRKPREDGDGKREPFPIGAVAGGLIVALGLVFGVATSKGFVQNKIVLKDGTEITGKIVKADEKGVEIAPSAGRHRTFLRKHIAEVRDDVPVGIPIYSYGFMMMVAFAAAIYVGAVRSRHAGIDPNVILDLGLWGMVFGIIGARIFHVIQFSDQFDSQSLLNFFKVWEGGLVFYGGLIGAVASGLAVVYHKKLPMRRLLDVTAPSIPLGVAFARFGCFLNGCCFGRLADPDNPLAVQFGEGSHALHRHLQLYADRLEPDAHLCLPVHPTQLYSSITAFTVFVLVSLYYRFTVKRRIHGEVFLLFVILYPIGRIVMESFRNDTDPVFGTGMTISQTISVSMLVIAVPLFIWAQLSRFAPAGEKEEADADAE